ncbi:MAG: SpoIIE family protein phosphatase [Cytophagales bacterium]|nr:SpoIIE family protein phosphatase [Cytophagales bacterium]
MTKQIKRSLKDLLNLKKVKQGETAFNRSERVMGYMYLFFLFIHIMLFVKDATDPSVPLLGLFQLSMIAGGMMYVFALWLVYRGFLNWSIVVWFLEMSGHSIIGVQVFGSELGVHYLFLLMPLVVFLTDFKLIFKLGFVAVSIVAFILVYKYGLSVIPTGNPDDVEKTVIKLGVSLIIVAAGIGFVFHQSVQNAEANYEREKKKVDDKNKEIMDSIRYAGNIQQAILPNEQELKNILSDHFIFFQPKDIVSGDFYWFHSSSPNSPPASRNAGPMSIRHRPPQMGDFPATLPKGKGVGKVSPLWGDGRGAVRGASSTVFIAACDCTGHGVPGAFLSMIGNDLLNHIIIEKGVDTPGDILSQLNRAVKKVFTRKGFEQQAEDGMDMTLCKIEVVNGDFVETLHVTSLQNPHSLQFAGACNPLFIIRKNVIATEIYKNALPFFSPPLEETQKKPGFEGAVIKGDKKSIGGHTELDYNFTNHKIDLKKGDTIYIFSDGFVDQFGGPDDRKFMMKSFKELLLSIQSKTMAEQKELLRKTINDWIGKGEQVDDMMVIGVRV